jgi:hypothetical protein
MRHLGAKSAAAATVAAAAVRAASLPTAWPGHLRLGLS